jgi:glycine betaine transporter
MQIWQQIPIADAVRADTATALFAMFDAMPFGMLMSGVATILVLVFFVTSGDSAVLVLGMMSSGGNPNPSTRTKLLWGGLIAGIAISLLLAGGLKALQTATIVFAVPFSLVIILMLISLWRGVREDWAAHEKQERELRRRVRQIVEK